MEGKSQQADDASFRQPRITSSDRDLGSRQALRGEDDLVWYPAEVNTSIRPGWFYHAAEDGRVKDFEQLRQVYLNSVGGTAKNLLNLPPDRRGLIHPADAASLGKLGRFIREVFRDNLAEMASISAGAALPGFGAEGLTAPGYETYFRTAEGHIEARIDLEWPRAQAIGYVVLQENIRLGQRVERFAIACEGPEGEDVILREGTVVGYKRIVRLDRPVTTRRLSILIRDARVFPTLAFIGVYGPWSED